MRVEADGKAPCDLALFGEAPGFEEQQQGRGFVGKSGRELWAAMERFCGLTREDFYVSNLIKIGLPKNRDPKPDEISAALPEFLDELTRVKPRIVVTAGSFATKAMLGNVKMSDVHGIAHECEVAGVHYVCFPIYHPAAGLHNKGFLSAFAWDLKQLAAFRRCEADAWAPARRPVTSAWLLGAPKPDFGASASLVAVDTEGWTEKPWGLSFSFDGSTGLVIPANKPKALAWFAGWLKGKTVLLHNGLHDVPVLRALGVRIGEYHDTQVLAYHDIIRTGSGVLEAESQNLGTLAYRECGLCLGELTDIAGVDFETQTIPYSDAVMRYAGEDPVATFRLFEVYRQRELLDYQPYQIDMGQVALVEEMIRIGLPFDEDRTLDYYADVLAKIDTLTATLRTKAARLGNRDFNPGSHPQVRELLTKRIGLRIRKRTKGGLASTNEKALADHQGHPFVEQLQSYRELTKLRGTYIGPLLEALQ